MLHTEKQIIGVLKWSIAIQYYPRIIDMIWKICYIVGIPSVILFIFANLLAFFLSAFFEVIFIFSFSHSSGWSPNVRKTKDQSS